MEGLSSCPRGELETMPMEDFRNFGEDLSPTQPMRQLHGGEVAAPVAPRIPDELETQPADIPMEFGTTHGMFEARGCDAVAPGFGQGICEGPEVVGIDDEDSSILGGMGTDADLVLPTTQFQPSAVEAAPVVKQKKIGDFFGGAGGGAAARPFSGSGSTIGSTIGSSIGSIVGGSGGISTTPAKRRQSTGAGDKAAKAPKASPVAQPGPGGALAAFGLSRSRWPDLCTEGFEPLECTGLEVRAVKEAVTTTSLVAALPVLEVSAPLMPSGKAIFAQLPNEWLDISGRKDALSGKCLFSSRRHEHSIFEPVASDCLVGVPETLREWQVPMDMPSNALEHASTADEEAWALEAHPGSGRVRLLVRPGVLLLRMLRRGTALPAARFSWRVLDGQDRAIAIDDAAPAAGFRVHARAAQVGEFSILSNVEDAAFSQPPRFAEFPLRREQLRSLGWMVAQERSRSEAFVTELRESTAFADAPHWKLEGRLHCEYNDVKGGVLADAIGYGKTACTIGLVDCTASDAFPCIPAPFRGLLPSRATLVLAPTNLHAQWLAEITKFTGTSLKVISVPTCGQLKRLSPQEIMEADVVVATYRLFYSNAYMHRLQEVAREVKKDFTFPSMFHGERLTRRQNASPEWSKAYRQVFDLLPEWAKRLRTAGAAEQATPLRPSGRAHRLQGSPASTEKSSATDAGCLVATPKAERRKRDKSQPAKAAPAEVPASSLGAETMTQDASASQLKRRRLSGKQSVAAAADPVPSHSAAWRGLLDGGDWSDHAHYVPLEAFWWRRVVCDEFHELLSRYPPAQVAVELFHADYKWGLSGTPPCQTLMQIRKAAGFFGVQIPTAGPSAGGDAEAEAPRQVAQEWLDAFVRRNTAELPDLEEEEHIVEVRQTEQERALYLALTQGQALPELDGSSQTQVYMPVPMRADGVEMPPEILDARQNTSGLLKLCSHFCASGATDVLTAADECDRQLAIRREVLRSSEREMLAAAEKATNSVSLIRHFEPHFCAKVDSANYGFVNWESKKILTARIAFLGVRILGTKANLSSRFFEVLESESASTGGGAAPLSEAAKARVLRVDFDPKCNETAKDLAAEASPAWAQMEALLGGTEEAPPRSGRSVLRRVLQECAEKSAAKGILSRAGRLRASLGMPRFAGAEDAPTEGVDELLGKRSKKNKASALRVQEWEWRADAENARSLHKMVDSLKRDVEHCSKRLLQLAGQIDGQQYDLDSFQDTLSTQINTAEPDEVPSPSAAEAKNFAKYGSKIEALVKHVQKLHADDHGCKVICFVQWEDLKRKISTALQEFEVEHLTLQGSVWARRAALVRFQYEEDSPRMLLLSLQESASGTNLTAANHVIIVHPMEAATREEAVAYEMQAMGRVRRPGQTRKIHIWRFVTVGTVEQQITEEHQKDLWERQHTKVELTAPAEALDGDSDTDVDGEPLEGGLVVGQDSANLDDSRASGGELSTQVYMAYDSLLDEDARCDEDVPVFRS